MDPNALPDILDDQEEHGEQEEEQDSEDELKKERSANKFADRVKLKFRRPLNFYHELFIFPIDESLDATPLPTRPSFVTHLSSLDLLSSSFTGSLRNITSIRELYKKGGESSKSMHKLTAEQMILQATELLNYLLVWNWIKTTAQQSLLVAFDCLQRRSSSVTSAEPWAMNIVRLLDNALSNRRPNHSLAFSILYSAIFGNTSFKGSFKVNIHKAHVLALGEEKRDVILLYATRALAQWFGLTKSQKELPLYSWDRRGEFLSLLLQKWGLGMFMLPAVTKAVWNPKHYLVDRISEFNTDLMSLKIKAVLARRKDSLLMLSTLRDCLISRYPEVAHLSSNGRSIFLSHNLQPTLLNNTNASSSLSQVHVQDGDEGESEILEDDVGPKSQPPPLPPPSALPTLLEFWTDLSEYPENLRLSEYLEWAIADPDRHIPFRNIAPSRRVILNSPNSPYRRDLTLTRLGLFNILVFRAITFATPFVTRDEMIWFDSVQDFNARVTGLDGRYYCDPTCYGSYSRNHSAENVDQYWEDSKTLHRWIHQQETRDFFLVFEKVKSFDNLGDLTAYLITADLAEAGVVESPDHKDFAKFVLRMYKGGGKCLTSIFKIIPQDAKERKTQKSVDIFLSLFSDLRKEIELSGCRYQLTIYDYEHLLCKYLRYHNHKYGLTGKKTKSS